MKLFRLFDWLLPDFFQLNVAGAIVGGAIIGGVANSMAASSAADAQTAAADKASATSMAQYNQTRADNQPYMARGNAAGNQLQYLMGLGGGGAAGSTVTADQLGNTASGSWTPNASLYSSSPTYKSAWDSYMADHQAMYGITPNNANGSTPGSLPGELAARGFDMNAYNTSAAQTQANNPAYGSLTQPFTQANLNSDVVYNTGLQFGLDQGTKGINNQAAATGSMLSGATLKALTQYGNDYGSQKAGDAWNRWNTDNTNTFNRLSGIAGTGQQANSLVANTGASTAGSISANQIGVGNSQAASAIGSGNAFSSGISSAINGYQTNQLLSGIRGGSGTGTGSPNIYGANGAGNSFVSSPNIYGANGGTGSAMVAY